MLDIYEKYKRFLVLFIIILLFSFTLRFARVLFEKQPIFCDEAIYIRWSQVMRAEPSLRFVPQSDGKQPLFMWATIPFLKILEDPLFAGRLLSVYTGLITTAGVVVLTLLLFKSQRIALTSGLIYAISPFTVFFDSMALADSMLGMFGVWSLLFAVITVKKVRLDTAMLSGFCLGGALLTKSPASFFALLLPLTLLIHKWPKKGKDKFYRLSVFVFLFTFTYAIGYGMYNILRLGPNYHMISVRNKDYVYPISHLLSSLWDPLMPFLHRVLQYFWIMGPGLILILLVVGIWVGLKKYKKETLLILTWGIIPLIAVAEFSKVMTARYIYFSVPYLIILSSLIFRGFDIKGKGLNVFNPSGCLSSNLSDIYKKVGCIAFIMFIFHSLFIDYLLIFNPQAANLPRSERSGYFEEWTAGYGIKEVSSLIQTEFGNNPNVKIVVGTEGYFGTLPDGLQIYLNNLPEITVIGVGQPVKEIPEPLIESYASGNKTYLVVNSSRLLVSLDNPRLKLISEYPKAVRPDGTQEKLYLLEVFDI